MLALEVVAQLGAPIVGDRHVHLDALLASQVARREGRQIVPSDPPDVIALPLARLHMAGEWVYAASASLFARQAPAMHHWTRRRDGRDIEGLQSRVNRAEGPGRDLLRRRPAVVASEVRWLAFGDEDAIRDLLSGVTHVGGLRAHGAGAVQAWQVETVDARAVGCVHDGARALRALPVSWAEGPTTTGACQMPYWHPARQVEIVPPGASCRLLGEPEVRDA